MSEQDFDPYHKWLGIPPMEQPPNHYRLLGLTLFESDVDVIDSAAIRQITHVRAFAIGQYSDISQTILGELTQARLTLLHPESKQLYDASLRNHGNSAPARQVEDRLQVKTSVKCPKCGVGFVITELFHGKTVRCTRCLTFCRISDDGLQASKTYSVREKKDTSIFDVSTTVDIRKAPNQKNQGFIRASTSSGKVLRKKILFKGAIILLSVMALSIALYCIIFETGPLSSRVANVVNPPERTAAIPVQRGTEMARRFVPKEPNLSSTKKPRSTEEISERSTNQSEIKNAVGTKTIDLLERALSTPGIISPSWRKQDDGSLIANKTANGKSLFIPAPELLSSGGYTLTWNLSNSGRRVSTENLIIQIPYTESQFISVRYFYGRTYNFSVAKGEIRVAGTRDFMGRRSFSLAVTPSYIEVFINQKSIGRVDHARVVQQGTSENKAIKFTTSKIRDTMHIRLYSIILELNGEGN